MTTKHEAALRALEHNARFISRAADREGWPDTDMARELARGFLAMLPTIRDALTAQGEAFASVHVVMREGPFPIKAIHDSRAGAEADAAMRGEDYEVETWRIQRDDPAPSAPPASDPDDLPYDDGPEEPWCWGPGSPEHETDQCLHNGWDE